MRQNWLIALTLSFLGLSAHAGQQIICETKCSGEPLKILFKERIHAGFGSDELVDFKIKCRDQGGMVDNGMCGYGDGVDFGIAEYFCIVAEDTVTVIGRARNDVFDPVYKTERTSRDRCEAKLRTKPDCDKSAGIKYVKIISTECHFE